MKSWLLTTLSSLALFSVAAFAQETPQTFEITEESLQILVSELRLALKDELEGVPFQVRLATSDELEEILFQEQLVLMRKQFEEEELATSQALLASRSVSRALLAKFVFATKEVLVVPENIDFVVGVLGRPELATRGTLRALLVHEMVHAVDEHRHGMLAVLQSIESWEALSAYNAVIEGHAQHVARGVCAKQGWTEDFETFTRAIGEVPAVEGEGEAMTMMRELQVEAISTAYYEGERFAAVVEESGGDVAVARMFKESPRDLLEIFHPEWYLVPGSRPVSPFDLERGLDEVGGVCPEQEWTARRLSVTPKQLELSLSLLPPEVVTRLSRGLRHNRMVSCSPKDGAQSMVVVALYEFTSPAEAGFYVVSAQRINKLKDEEDVVEFHSIRYEPLGGAGLQGFLTEKHATFQGQPLALVNLVVASGSLCAELLSVNTSIRTDELVALTRKALEAAARPGSTPADEDGEAPKDR